MTYLPLRTVQKNPEQVDAEMLSSGPVVITRNGKPIWVISAVDEDDLMDYLIDSSPELRRQHVSTVAAVRSGDEETRPWEDLRAELETSEAIATATK